MEDRHLEESLFANFDQMRNAFEHMLDSRPDYSDKVLKDKNRLQEHVECIRNILSESTGESWVSAAESKDEAADLIRQLNSQVHYLQLQVIGLSGQLRRNKPKTELLQQFTEPIDRLLDLYTSRPDLQSTFPEVASGDYSRLLIWAKNQLALGQGSAEKALLDHAEWYDENSWVKIAEELNKTRTDLNQRESTIQNIEAEKTQLAEELNKTRTDLNQRESTIQNIGQQLRQTRKELEEIRSSFGYKVMRFYSSKIDRLCPEGTKRGDLRKILVASAKVLTEEGIHSYLRQTLEKIRRREFRILDSQSTTQMKEKNEDAYEDFLARNDSLPEKEMRREIRNFRLRPKISIVTPVYNPDIMILKQMIQSVRQQIYGNWELCICDDASQQHIWEALLAQRKEDNRIELERLNRNLGVAASSNRALHLATGEFVAFLDHDDVITKDALYEVVKAVNEMPDVDVLYTDEDKITEDGTHRDPFFKPGWSPELLRCIPYVSHLTVIRKSLVERIKGFDERFRQSPDYDLQLRATDEARRVVHIPRVLYSWRMSPTSVSDSKNRRKFELLCKENLNELRKFVTGKKLGTVTTWIYPNTFRVSYHMKGNPLVTIIIPTYDKVELLKKCLNSIELSSYSNREVLLITNNQIETSEMWAYLRTLPYKVLKYKGDFSWSGMNNLAAEAASGEYLIFLNDDIEVISRDWIERLLGYAQQPDVGAVGAKLLFPDGRCQHAGVTGDPVYVAYHQFKDIRGDGYYSMIILPREVSAVTGACMMTRKTTFEKVHGFDSHLQHLYNDIDYCWRLGELGLSVIYAASAILHHHEGASRYGRIDYGIATRDTLYMHKKWRWKLLGGDPFHTRNLINARIDMFGLTRSFYPAPQPRGYEKSLLMVSHNLNLEGAPLGLFNIAKYLKSRGHSVAVISPHDGRLRDAYLKHGIPVLIVPDLGHLCLTENEDLRTFMASFDVVFANTILMYFVVLFVKSFGFGASSRVVWIIRESPDLQSFCKELRITPETIRQSFTNSDRVVFLCSATRDLFSQFDEKGNFMVIHDSIDLDEYSELPKDSDFHLDRDQFNVLNVGTIYPGKGQDTLVDAAIDMLTSTRYGLTFCFIGKIGDRNFYDLLQSRIKKHGLSDRIFFEGELSRPDTIAAYSECDAFVLPSRRESFPTAVLEAMAAGKPIIATRIFGVVEQLKHDYSGMLIEPNDRTALIDSLLRLYDDRAFATWLGNNARSEFLQRFTLRTMGDEYRELVQSLTAEARDSTVENLQSRQSS